MCHSRTPARILWYPTQMPGNPQIRFESLYEEFDVPIGNLDCGKKCAPYNEGLVPFCCDTRHIVPSGYLSEWHYLKSITDLWHLWQPEAAIEAEELEQQVPTGQVLLECLGHKSCQRAFRSIACRAFPFFPYMDHNGIFQGISYYVEYQELCWVISNLEYVSAAYCQAFFQAYKQIFKYYPAEIDNFSFYSEQLRMSAEQEDSEITILDNQGKLYEISPSSGRKQNTTDEDLSKFGPYKIAAMLPFPDEID